MWRYMTQKSMTSSLFGSKSKVKAKGGGRLQAVKSVTVLGKCSAISDGDWTVFPQKIGYSIEIDVFFTRWCVTFLADTEKVMKAC